MHYTVVEEEQFCTGSSGCSVSSGINRDLMLQEPAGSRCTAGEPFDSQMLPRWWKASGEIRGGFTNNRSIAIPAVHSQAADRSGRSLCQVPPEPKQNCLYNTKPLLDNHSSSRVRSFICQYREPRFLFSHRRELANYLGCKWEPFLSLNFCLTLHIYQVWLLNI